MALFVAEDEAEELRENGRTTALELDVVEARRRARVELRRQNGGTKTLLRRRHLRS